MPYYVYDKIISPNIWDEEWEVGSISNSDGSNTTSSGQIRSKNYIRVIPNTTYYFCYKGNNVIGKIVFYDGDKNLISITSHTKNTTFIVPSNVIYMRFVIGDLSIPITTYNNDICINVSNPAINGTYYPYNMGAKKYVIKDNNNSMNIGG